MLIISKQASYNNMPAFGGIVSADKLMFGLRATSPQNLVNLGRAGAITRHNIEFKNKGVQGGMGRSVKTSFDTNSAKDLTIRATAKAIGIGGSAKKCWVAGSLTATSGLGLFITALPNGSNYDYHVRFYCSALGSTGRILRNAQATFATNTNLTDTPELHIWAKVNTQTKRLHIKVNNGTETIYGFSSDDYEQRADTPWQVCDVAFFSPDCDSLVRELLVWNTILTPEQMAQQDTLSQKWLEK